MLFNKARALEFMRQCRLDALVATSPMSVTYMSDHYCWINRQLKEYMRTPGGSGDIVPCYAVFPRDGSPALVLNSIFAINASEIWIKDLYLFGDPIVDDSLASKTLTEPHRMICDQLRSRQRSATPTDALLSILRDRGLTNARIGLESEALPAGLKETIIQAVPHADVCDCSDLLRLIRMVKSPEEIVRLRRAAEIAEQSAQDALSTSRRGVHTCEVAQYYRRRVAEQGADFDHFAFGFRGLGVACKEE